MQHEYQVLASRPHQEHDIGWTTAEQLQSSGYYRSTGLPVGQFEDFRRAMSDGRGIHIRHYADGRWTAHWDHVDPSVDLVAHLAKDAPVAGLILAGVGLAFLAGWGSKSVLKS